MATEQTTSDVSNSTAVETNEEEETALVNDASLEEMKEKLAEMEAEAKKLREVQAQVEKDLSTQTFASKQDVDSRSVYVGGVDFSATPEELQTHFQSCGTILRITILCDKLTGRPKGHAYVEFADAAAVANAIMLNDSLFKGRQLKVTAKRTNVPAWQLGRGGAAAGFSPRGRGARGGRGAFRGGRATFRGRGRGYGYRPY